MVASQVVDETEVVLRVLLHLRLRLNIIPLHLREWKSIFARTAPKMEITGFKRPCALVAAHTSGVISFDKTARSTLRRSDMVREYNACQEIDSLKCVLNRGSVYLQHGCTKEISFSSIGMRFPKSWHIRPSIGSAERQCALWTGNQTCCAEGSSDANYTEALSDS